MPELLEILDIQEQEQNSIIKKLNNASYRDNILVVQNLSWEQIVKLEERMSDFRFAILEVGKMRRYLFGDLFSSVIGYVGILNHKEKEQIGLSNIGSFAIGKNGVEKKYELALRGEFGHKEIEVNAYGVHIRELNYFAPKNGNDLNLNIHLGLQNLARSILNNDGSSCIVMKVDTGEVLALCSLPSFDPNKLTQRISHEYWTDIMAGNKMMNRAIQSTYAPGSIFKLVTVLSAIEAGIDPNIKLSCHGGPFLGDHFRCARTSGHGIISSMTDGIKFSCNHYMYQLAKMVGNEKILATAMKCGFGTKADIDLPFEANGFLPSDSWKQSVSSMKWGLADTLNISIGQGAILATPIQLAKFIAAIANGGYLVTPQIFSQNRDISEMQRICSQSSHLDILRTGMIKCTNEPGGTSYSSRIQGANYMMAGKTSTSQVISKQNPIIDLNSRFVVREYRNHALFAGFVPTSIPKYVALVVIEHGGGGGMVAAPVAKQILSYCMEHNI